MNNIKSPITSWNNFKTNSPFTIFAKKKSCAKIKVSTLEEYFDILKFQSKIKRPKKTLQVRRLT